MRGGKPKGASEQWMRNALATGGIVPPSDPKVSSNWPSVILVALGSFLVIVSIVFW